MGGKDYHPMISHFALCFLLFIVTLPQILAMDYPINVWPKPRTFQWPNPGMIPLSANFTISHPNHQYLTPAVDRYLTLVLTENHRPLVPPALNITSSSPLTTLSITISDIVTPLMHGVNESYNLSIDACPNSSTSLLIAQTVLGAMHGLETFSQLVYGNPAVVAAGVYISDEPIFRHRGVMLDTSRNYYEVDHLLRLIGAMSMNKLNVFHWHITDSHSFPLVLPSEPELASKGAYGDDMKYTTEDVKKVVQFGMEYGVRVVPKIDMPAHTGSWAAAYPDIVTCENMFWLPAGAEWLDRLAAEPGTGQLNLMNPLTYEVAKNVITDVASMFPDAFYHAGADEITPNCWKTDPSIQSFLSKNGTLSQLLETFVNSTLPYIVSLNKTVVYWEDVFLDSEIRVEDISILPIQNVILQTWNNGPNNTKKIVDAGYQVIVSSAGYYYLDCGHGDFVGNNSQYDQPQIIENDTTSGGSWCGPFKTWQTIYNYDITDGLNAFEAKLVLGGDVALWSEQADRTVLDSRVWPRTSAMAETLWSGNRDENGVKRYAEATDRLNEWRYRMVNRRIGAEPIQPLWCVRNKGMCNTVN